MSSGRRRSISFAIPIIALATALCLTHLVSFPSYQSAASANHSRQNLSPNASSEIPSAFQRFPKLRKRADVPPLDPMSDETWNKKVTKGRSINCLFEKPLEQVPQSKFTKWQDTIDWGWDFEEDTSFYMDHRLGPNDMAYLDTFYDKYLLPTKPWDTPGLRVYSMEHKNNYKPPGSIEELKPTGAQYNGWALIGGSEVTQYYLASEMYSPWYRGELNGVKEMPDLQRWSDVFALEWYHLQGGVDDGSSRNIATPRYIIIPSLVRYKTDTQEAVIRACLVTNQQLGDMPGGCEFQPIGDTAEGFFGMLGTAHLQGMGFMLAQHKAWFGNRRIEKITAWIKPKEDDNTNYNLLVTIADIEPDGNERRVKRTTLKQNEMNSKRVIAADKQVGIDNDGNHLPKPKW